jgi:hypothetical protein
VALAAVVVVLGAAAVIVVPYFFRAHPGAVAVKSVVRGFKSGGASGAHGVAYVPPAQGVYTLKGSGMERINFPPNSQQDGATMPASVTYDGDGCWRWRVDYNIAHWETYLFCPKSTRMLERSEANSQTWDFGTVKVANLAQFACTANAVVLPTDPATHQTLRWSCTGGNSAISGRTVQRVTVHLLGEGNLKVGAATVRAVHEEQDVTLSGVQRGTVAEDWWLSLASGLPLRMERRITILSSSPVGTVTYTESGSWRMASVHPQTSAPAKHAKGK